VQEYSTSDYYKYRIFMVPEKYEYIRNHEGFDLHEESKPSLTRTPQADIEGERGSLLNAILANDTMPQIELSVYDFDPIDEVYTSREAPYNYRITDSLATDSL
jgi:hypothetical protein